MSEHTPGPWQATRHPWGELENITSEDGTIVLNSCNDVLYLDPPDLSLILAVPDLLEAAGQALDYLDEVRKTWGDEAVLRRRADQLRAAVAKAKGEGS